jgi:hypothetical protein
VSQWTEVFLGVIAVASLAMAIVHVAVLVAAGLLARRVGRLADRIELEIRPVFESMQAIARDASKAAALATTQVERADRLFSDLVQRAEQTVNTIHESLGTSVRNGRALINAFRAGFRAMRDLRQERARRRQGRDDEDALFI